MKTKNVCVMKWIYSESASTSTNQIDHQIEKRIKKLKTSEKKISK